MADMLDLFTDIRIDGIDIEEGRDLDYDKEEDYPFDDVFGPAARSSVRGKGMVPTLAISRGFGT